MSVKTNALKKIANRVADFILKRKQLSEAKKIGKLNRELDATSLGDKAMREENIPAYLRRGEEGFGTNARSIYNEQSPYFLRGENGLKIPGQNNGISNTKTTYNISEPMWMFDQKLGERLRRSPTGAVDTPFSTINGYGVSPAAKIKDVVNKRMYKTGLKFGKNGYKI